VLGESASVQPELKPPLIGIAGIRNRLAVRGARMKTAGFASIRRQARALGADVSDLEQPIGPERLLQIQVPVLRVGSVSVGDKVRLVSEGENVPGAGGLPLNGWRSPAGSPAAFPSKAAR